jgi:hypothetical protein
MARLRDKSAHAAIRKAQWAAYHQSRLRCIGTGNDCPRETVDDCPVPLCSHHLREVYTFAADLVTERWDGAVREYVADLHETFKPPPALKQPASGWVYFIRFSDRIKIGYTTKPDNRLRDLPHEQVIGVIPGTRSDEAAWHELLTEFHVVGEWFRAEPAVLEMLERVARQKQGRSAG